MKFKSSDFSKGQFYKLKTQSFIILDKKSINGWFDRISVYFVTCRNKQLKGKKKDFTSGGFEVYLNRLCPSEHK
jgi:hypothetical protein